MRIGSEGAKMESEGPYTVKEENGVSNLYLHKIELEGHTNMFLMDLKTLCKELNTAYGVGAKSECERCAKIAEDHALLLNSPGEAAACREVAEMIRGGQDGEWGAV